MNNYTSDELFHFVGYSSPKDDSKNYEKLGKILNSNCVSYSPPNTSWGEIGYTTEWENRLETEKLIVPNVTCFADIPYEALSVHISKYGKFGISLPRWLLTKHGARPVMYIPLRSDDLQSIFGLTLVHDIEAIVKGFNKQVVQKLVSALPEGRSLGIPPGTEEEAIFATSSMLNKDFLAFIKPFDSELPHDDPNNYYMEREWRKYGNMKFEENQISKVVVAKGYKERAINDFPAYQSRIYEIE